jgi:predicted Rossmann fold nucleotide-binding protein DprA/Smf involved in DNA uptake
VHQETEGRPETPMARVEEALAPVWRTAREVARRAQLSLPETLRLLEQLRQLGRAETARGTYRGEMWRLPPSS